MANQDHLDILRQGVEVWNKWHNDQNISGDHFNNIPDLSTVNLSGMDLCDIDFSWVDLTKSNLSHAKLLRADLTEACLVKADLRDANLLGILGLRSDFRGANLNRAKLCLADMAEADLRDVNLRGADLWKVDLSYVNLIRANLDGATLTGANLSNADLSEAKLKNCRVYSVSAWNVKLDGAIQANLIVTEDGKPEITVDNLECAQFIYLLLNNRKIRDVINTITSKVVLILGRFTDERKPVLDALRDELRNYNYSPIVFDFEKPGSRNLTETISTLAHLSRFIVADLTDAKSIPQELERIVPRLRVPVQSLLHVSENDAYAMYRDFEDYHWVLPIHRYSDQDTLLRSLREYIIDPAEQKARELEKRK